MDRVRRTYGIRAAARPLAVGLLVFAWFAPASFEVRPVVAVPRDELVVPSLAAQAPIIPVMPAGPASAVSELLEPSPDREVPTVLTVAGESRPLPFVTPPPLAEIGLQSGSSDGSMAIGPATAEHAPPGVAVAAAPFSSNPLAPAAPLIVQQAPEAIRAVDIAQIDAGRAPSVRVPQLHEPGLTPGGPSLADKTAAMQVVLPPPARLSQQELALLQSDTPSRMTIRLGEEAVGQVAFRMNQNRTIDVQLSGILDVLSDRFGSEDFARLRESAAADSYVPLDTLRSVGLGLRYDPVYDELRVSA